MLCCVPWQVKICINVLIKSPALSNAVEVHASFILLGQNSFPVQYKSSNAKWPFYPGCIVSGCSPWSRRSSGLTRIISVNFDPCLVHRVTMSVLYKGKQFYLLCLIRWLVEMAECCVLVIVVLFYRLKSSVCCWFVAIGLFRDNSLKSDLIFVSLFVC